MRALSGCFSGPRFRQVVLVLARRRVGPYIAAVDPSGATPYLSLEAWTSSSGFRTIPQLDVHRPSCFHSQRSASARKTKWMQSYHGITFFIHNHSDRTPMLGASVSFKAAYRGLPGEPSGSDNAGSGSPGHTDAVNVKATRNC